MLHNRILHNRIKWPWWFPSSGCWTHMGSCKFLAGSFLIGWLGGKSKTKPRFPPGNVCLSWCFNVDVIACLLRLKRGLWWRQSQEMIFFASEVRFGATGACEKKNCPSKKRKNFNSGWWPRLDIAQPFTIQVKKGTFTLGLNVLPSLCNSHTWVGSLSYLFRLLPTKWHWPLYGSQCCHFEQIDVPFLCIKLVNG